MNLVKTFSTLSVAAAGVLMMLGAQGTSHAQSIGVLGAQRPSPGIKLSIKVNGWLDNGAAKGTEYFGTAYWNSTACFKAMAFSQDADGTEHVDATGAGTFYDTVNYVAIKATVVSHFIKRSDGTSEAHVTITDAKTGDLLYTNETTAQSLPTMLPGALMEIEMPNFDVPQE